MNKILPDNPGVIAPPPLLFAGALVVGLLLHSRFRFRLRTPRLLRFVLGGALIGAACTTVWFAFQAMQRAHTDTDPHHPTTAIVEDGPYQFTRNPLYLSLVTFYTGIAMLFNAITALLTLPILVSVMRRGVIDREERYLERKFGAQYLNYKARVPRWL
jgi:protein-S-isoprenylcysteine O-methyltransferase Ste14